MMLIALIALVLCPAHAEDEGPYMWGVGPTVGTIVYPGQFPGLFPRIENANGDKERVALDHARGDALLGARGELFIDKRNRVGARLNLGLGSGGYSSLNFTAEYDLIAVDKNNVGAFIGAGAGFGTMNFNTEDVGKLHLATYLLRAQTGVYFRDKVRAYEADVFGQIDLPGAQLYTPAGETEGVDASGGLYAHIGVEATVYFGDFRPPSAGKKKKKNDDN